MKVITAEKKQDFELRDRLANARESVKKMDVEVCKVSKDIDNKTGMGVS